jgi:hypothetical protein
LSFHEKADNPSDLIFFIVSQGESHPTFDFLPNEQIIYKTFSTLETKGICWARSLINQEDVDYDYFLQIDGHMIAAESWDTALINKHNLHAGSGNKVVLTCNPSRYYINENSERVKDTTIVNTAITLDPWVHGGTKNVQAIYEDQPNYQLIHKSFLFSTKQFVLDVPYDEQMSYYYEEFTMSARALYNSYNIVAICSPIFYHMFAEDRKANGQKHIFELIKEDNTINTFIVDNYNDKKGERFREGLVEAPYGVPKEFVDQYIQNSKVIFNNEVDNILAII